MNKPKSITQLSKEQLEDMCLNLMHVDNEKAKIIEQLEQENQQLKEVINKAIEYINNNYPLRTSFSKNIYDFKIEIKKILTGDSNE